MDFTFHILLKGKANPLQTSVKPLGLQAVEAPRIPRKSAHEGDKVGTGRLYPQGNILGAYF